MQSTILQIVVAAVISGLTVIASGSTETIPVEIMSEPLAPLYMAHLEVGVPADSLVLRVSLYYDIHNEINLGMSFIVVDELRWPTPPRNIGIAQLEDGSFEELPGEKWLLRSSRIDGDYLYSAMQELPPPERSDGLRMRAGQLWVRGKLPPLKFVSWISATEFMVEDGLGRYTIRWRAPSELELVDVTRLK